MHSVILPNGLKIYASSKFEAQVLYQEIFTEKTYSSHGIKISDGDCIFDIGANIGLYSIFLTQNHHDLKIFAFEPIPQTYSILEKNVERDQSSSQVKLFNFGLSRKSGSSQFEFDRFASFTATMRPEEVNACVRKDAGMYDWVRAGISDLQKASFLSRRSSDRLLAALPRPIVGKIVVILMFALLLLTVLRKKIFLKKIECGLKTITEVMRDHNIDSVALMKIDVEGSELEVIEGIADEDWPRIRQCVVEVHDFDGRVEKLRSIFEKRGYRTVVDQEEWCIHKLINAFTIYAVRS